MLLTRCCTLMARGTGALCEGRSWSWSQREHLVLLVYWNVRESAPRTCLSGSELGSVLTCLELARIIKVFLCDDYV